MYQSKAANYNFCVICISAPHGRLIHSYLFSNCAFAIRRDEHKINLSHIFDDGGVLVKVARASSQQQQQQIKTSDLSIPN